MKSPYVPESFKKAIKDVDSKVVRKLLKNILNGKNPEIFALDDVNKAAIIKYLQGVAERNNMSYEDLLKDEKKLKEVLSELNDVSDLVKGWEELSDTMQCNDYDIVDVSFDLIDISDNDF